MENKAKGKFDVRYNNWHREYRSKNNRYCCENTRYKTFQKGKIALKKKPPHTTVTVSFLIK